MPACQVFAGWWCRHSILKTVYTIAQSAWLYPRYASIRGDWSANHQKPTYGFVLPCPNSHLLRGFDAKSVESKRAFSVSIVWSTLITLCLACSRTGKAQPLGGFAACFAVQASLNDDTTFEFGPQLAHLDAAVVERRPSTRKPTESATISEVTHQNQCSISIASRVSPQPQST